MLSPPAAPGAASGPLCPLPWWRQPGPPQPLLRALLEHECLREREWGVRGVPHGIWEWDQSLEEAAAGRGAAETLTPRAPQVPSRPPASRSASQDSRSWASPGQTNGESPLELPAARFQAGLGRASDSAVLVLPPSPGARSRSPRPSVDSEGGGRLLEEDSEVLKMLQENREGRAAPRQSSSFRLLQEALEAEERGGTPVFLPSSLSPQPLQAPGRALATPPKLHTCEKCSSSIAPDSGPGPSSRPSPRPRLTPPLPQEPGRAHPGRALPPPRLLRVRRLRAEPQDARALLGGGRALLREARPPALLGVLGPQPAGLSALRPQPAG
ncbi:PDZ and LIM domain protein 2 isoform X4 [Dasypus novemcinctus]|uniref:PDZ and LIM domain protein 2 isoform X4 n=1 Tax=Dasypus novemcinctus TaxID=9361 RepID=UPI0039C91667